MDEIPDRAPSPTLTEIVIPKEKAVFWMDDRGRWCNRHGRFEHKRIIDHFNRAIKRDRDGYYVTQVRGNIREKVYFAYDDTPLFALQVTTQDPMRLQLNTGEAILLDPAKLFVHDDQLYQRRGDERIRFGERALVTMAPYLDDAPNGLVLCLNQQTYAIPSQPIES